MPKAITKQEVYSSGMLGSFKQVRWGLGLQRDFLAASTAEERPMVREIISARNEAGWWIDHRFRTVAELIRDYREEIDNANDWGSGDLAMVLACTGEDQM